MSKATTRSEAKALGVTRYFTGVPCKYGHLAERSLSGNCVVCLLEHKRKWRLRYPEYRKNYYEENKNIEHWETVVTERGAE